MMKEEEEEIKQMLELNEEEPTECKKKCNIKEDRNMKINEEEPREYKKKYNIKEDRKRIIIDEDAEEEQGRDELMRSQFKQLKEAFEYNLLIIRERNEQIEYLEMIIKGKILHKI
uniref:Uncharacterized protein n=1 Tax=Cacopsylla melanoneura TaxID=428564 RepID=A0A8D8QQH9_9HEMI